MSSQFIITVLIGVWAFVIYRLISGSKITQITEKNRYNIVSIIVAIVAMIIFLIKNYSLLNLLCSFGVVLAYILYTCIPSGYNEEAIYIHGKKCPYNKIDEVRKEPTTYTYRLSFRYRYRFYYIDAKRENRQIIEYCEYLYKKGRNK